MHVAPTVINMFYGVPLGCDFVKEAVSGLIDRHPDPLDLARVTVILNAGRFRSALEKELESRVDLLPKLITVDEFVEYFTPFEASRERHSLESEVLLLAQMLVRMNMQQPIPLFNNHERFDLAYGLLDLLDQVMERDLSPERFLEIELEKFAEHWQLNAKFFQILVAYWDQQKSNLPMFKFVEQVRKIKALWGETPLQDPLYIMGSTGSRPIMRQIMDAVSVLPKTAVVLPSFDFHSVAEITDQEHPQFGMNDLLKSFVQSEVQLWSGQAPIHAKFVSSVVMQAPQTDYWRANLEDIGASIEASNCEITLITARSRYEEARAIFAKIVSCVENQKNVTVVSADRLLVRELVHWLDAFQIEYDDSTGNPLLHSPLARLCTQFLDYVHRPSSHGLLELLHHPDICIPDKAWHHKQLQIFDEKILRKYPGLDPWNLCARAENETLMSWSYHWQSFFDRPIPQKQGLAEWLDWLVENICALTGIQLDLENEKVESPIDLEVLHAFRKVSVNANSIAFDLDDFIGFWKAWIARKNAKPMPMKVDPWVKILGTIEVRAETSDVLIQAGLNEGFWPSPSRPDMWLNRDIRNQLGLETPERYVGLAAHDFISGICAKEWVMTRSQTLDGTQTVESRFLRRLKTLMLGAHEQTFKNATKRGQIWIEQAKQLIGYGEPSVGMTPRPAVLISNSQKPSELAATAIEKYVKNPYQAFVEKVLGLRPIDPVRNQLGPSQKGNLWHEIFEGFTLETRNKPFVTVSELSVSFQMVLDDYKIEDLERLQFEIQFKKLAPGFIENENERRNWADEIRAEQWATTTYNGGEIAMQLSARVDRIDIDGLGNWRVFDYKPDATKFGSKAIDLKKAQQFHLCAYILSRGDLGFHCDQIGAISYLPKHKLEVTSLYDDEIFAGELKEFLAKYLDEAVPWQINPDAPYCENINYFARFGEWLDSHEPKRIDLLESQRSSHE